MNIGKSIKQARISIENSRDVNIEYSKRPSLGKTLLVLIVILDNIIYKGTNLKYFYLERMHKLGAGVVAQLYGICLVCG